MKKYLNFLCGVFCVIFGSVMLGSFMLGKHSKTDNDFAVAFSPRKGAEALVVRVIDTCHTYLRAATYGITNEAIANKLVEAKNRHLDIKIVSDKRGNSSKSSKVNAIKEAGIDIRLNGHYAIHHHKFIICDDKILETGSFNYTESAQKRNAENVLVLWNVPGIVASYKKEWQRLFDEASPVKTNGDTE